MSTETTTLSEPAANIPTEESRTAQLFVIGGRGLSEVAGLHAAAHALA